MLRLIRPSLNIHQAGVLGMAGLYKRDYASQISTVGQNSPHYLTLTAEEETDFEIEEIDDTD